MELVSFADLLLRRMDRSFDVCVIGAGLWGSAAARHLSQSPGMKVCLIGPEEPKKEVGWAGFTRSKVHKT